MKFRAERQAYTVQASGGNFVVLNKPFNARNTTLYTIIDWVHGVRGPENLVFGMGAETREHCEEMLQRLLDKEDPSEVSSRRWLELDIEKIWFEPIRRHLKKELPHGK